MWMLIKFTVQKSDNVAFFTGRISLELQHNYTMKNMLNDHVFEGIY